MSQLTFSVSSNLRLDGKSLLMAWHCIGVPRSRELETWRGMLCRITLLSCGTVYTSSALDGRRTVTQSEMRRELPKRVAPHPALVAQLDQFSA